MMGEGDPPAASSSSSASPADAAAKGSTPQEKESIAALQLRVAQLKARRESLKAELEERRKRAETRQDAEDAEKDGLLGPIEATDALRSLSEEMSELEERTILYRTTGWTCFEMDLDVGRRERSIREMQSANDPHRTEKSGLGLGVRLETFWRGQYYEPFYLVFAQESQLLRDTAQIVTDFDRDAAQRLDQSTRQELSKLNPGVRLWSHTIPHFVPLQDLLKRYLKPEKPESDDEDRSGEAAHIKGGLELLNALMKREDLDLFLSHLHCYLLAFVSRRQQALLLRDLAIPGLPSSDAAGSLEAFFTASLSQLSIRWLMPVPTIDDLRRLQGDQTNSESAERKRKRREGHVNVVVEIFILYEDLEQDRLGPLAKEVSPWVSSIKALNRHQQRGTRGTAGIVLVEVLRSRVPGAKRGSTAVLNNATSKEPRRYRREDLEARFLAPTPSQSAKSKQGDGEDDFDSDADDDFDESPELDDALKDVLGTVWREEVLRQLT